MGLKIMCAGCSKDEREQAEATVRRALGPAADTDAWTVSLVKLGTQWSVRLDALTVPGRARTLMAPEGKLAESIAEAVRGAELDRPASPLATPAASPPAAAAAPPETAGGIACLKCGRAFTVVYDVHAGEPLREAPVACPYCWHVNRVPIGVEAAESSDYRAEKLEG